jgi:hypothetical protein
MASNTSFTAMAVQNPMFQNAAKSAAFQALKDEEGDNELFNSNAASVVDPTALDVDEKELGRIRFWARVLRIAMLVICTLMFVTGFYNFLGTSSSISTSFLAGYLLFFTCLMCCYELALKQAAIFIVQNFGFLYNSIGRSIFLSFVAIVCYQISTLGKICFGLLIGYGLVSIFVHWRHPQYSKYMQVLHAYNRTKAKRTTPTTVQNV